MVRNLVLKTTGDDSPFNEIKLDTLSSKKERKISIIYRENIFIVIIATKWEQ